MMDTKKPGSSSVHNVSRQSALAAGSASTTGYASRLASSIPPHLQVLSSEELMENNYDMDIEEIGSSGSEYTEDSEDDSNFAFTGRTESVFGIAEPLTDRSKPAPQFDSQSQQSEDDYLAVRQLALLENESDDISVCSEEERDIMAEIRAEITQKVREEMKSELEVYQKAKENLNKGKDNTEDDLADVEPELKEAIIKMRKLDKILNKKIKREKEVKRERIMLEKRLHEELENLKASSQKKITADEKRNTEKFLALTLPPSHNAGISLEQPEVEVPSSSPVFQTQIPEDMQQRQTTQNTESARSQTGVRSSTSGASQSGATSVSGMSTMTEDSTGKKMKRKKKKNFIKRNIQLASDAANVVAMTDDEKKRLEDLLNDLEALPEGQEDDHSIQNDTPNPFQVVATAGGGFTPTPNQKQRLDDIEFRLQSLMPPDEYMSLTAGSVSDISHRDSVLFTRTTLSCMGSNIGDQLGIGEEALKEAKEKREQQERLNCIEDELNHLTNAVQSEMESPSLTEEQLNKLLDDCAHTMSRATQETTSIASSRSAKGPSRMSLYENPPHLPEPVLRKLLEDTRKELSGEERSTDFSINRQGNLLLQSLSEESTLRDSVSSSHNGSIYMASNSANSDHSLLRLRRSDSPEKCYSPRVKATPILESERRPFLPEIDPKGRLSTQSPLKVGLNNEQAGLGSQPVYRKLSEVYMVRNSFTNGTITDESSHSSSEHSDCDDSSDDDDDADDNKVHQENTPTPHPPSSARRSGNQGHGRTRYL